MSTAPKLTVGLPVYNGEAYIAASIDSILGQTFGDFELVISDNASTDATEEICRQYAGSDSRIRYVRNTENVGAAGNYNRLVDAASADYFRWQNADDIAEPELHERCVGVLDANPDAVLCYGKTLIIDQDGAIQRPYDDNLHLVSESPSRRFVQLLQSVGLTNVVYGLMRTDAVRRTGLMGDGSFPAADVNFMAELSLYGTFVEIPETLFRRRMHVDASSWNRSNDAVQKTFWTSGGSGFELGNWRKHLAHIKAIWRAPISLSDKLRANSYVLRMMVWQKADLLTDLTGAARDRLKKATR